ncbi:MULTISPECIES: cell wall metabolism sensor histidine kinase WalK [unclassified Rhodococcus (in: high G+C Gram-positive bacteria)]|uniref:sensor histidine kinase n=1 Tax=unclassified Rhodococcus (in: high G+C Gram-positive bacteria) TaxID=192944 RepID=UPI00163B04A0|nr:MULTISPECIES: HAMP domain-containing sensor histidine kinase [unclassified Rhodococcus (in: high G+C Gram-positive bacteria)]MBC2639958.1 HAMP domain-containing histidine kinase [Rhodococcus sp. 3A]MBC2895295.1 HAMP domain-containing histidine kinase [Rhodococcus sp. 4CII]
MPLRFTLVGAVLLLAALGLLASGVAVTSALENSLTSRVDRQLHDAAQGWAKPHGARPLPPPDEPNPGRPPSPFYVRTTLPNGTVLREINDEDVSPALPDHPATVPVTVGSADGSDVRWRVLTTTAPDGIETTVAMTLTENDETVNRLIVLQLIIGVVVLIVLGVVAYFVVRRSLRPLVEVEETAAAIASGDLHRRVPERDDRTEIGRLSVALNGMLAQIQHAFAATEASEESARRSEEKMRRFVADASHELRTPLTTIRGFAELYRQGAMTDTETLMSRIEGEASRMGLLVEDLLMLARLDAQRPLETRPVDLLSVVSDAVHGARAVAPDRSIALDILPGPGTPEVIGDEARLRQVLGNLLANAVKHTPATADVTVRLSTTEQSVVLEVADTGPGLSEQDAARVFERFYRTDASRTRESGGSGLGLSIVSALVAAHRGSVTVDSRPGEGATFRVELPRSS